VLVHGCVVCGFVRPSRIAGDPVQGDDIDAIIALMSEAGSTNVPVPARAPWWAPHPATSTTGSGNYSR